MAIVQEIFGNGGGSQITLDKLLYNAGKTLLGSITTYNGSYTTTEDCVMYGYGKGASGSNVSPIIYIDSNPIVFANSNSSGLWQVYIGYSSSSISTPDSYGMFIPKGATVSTRNQSGQSYKLEFYTLD